MDNGKDLPLLPLGTQTNFGQVVGIRSEGGPLGERYYFLKRDHLISFMPAIFVERKKRKGGIRRGR